MRYRPELDGLRGIAVLVVLAAHAGVPGIRGEGGGGAGVTLFFVLSGFLITSLIVAERERDGRVNLPAFYVRRGLRLLPALFALVFVVIIAYGFGLWVASPPDGLAIAAVVGYVGNWASVAGLQLGVLAHTWSLAVEEQFYLLWPALLLLGLRLGGRRRTAVAILAISIMVTPWRMILWSDGAFDRVLNGTDTHADALLIGCAIALLNVRLPSRIGLLGALAIVGLGIAWRASAEVYFLPLAAIAAAIAVAGCPEVLGWRPLAYVGRISYGLYLWHYLFIWSGLPWPVVIFISFVTAVVSFQVIERPFLRLKDRLGSPDRKTGDRAIPATTTIGTAMPAATE